MNLSEYMIGLNESAYGISKVDRPTEAGLNVGIKAANQFAKSSDPQDTDIDLAFNDAFSEDDGSGFANRDDAIPSEKVNVDPNTIPAMHAEEDQFEDADDGNDSANEHISDSELAEDDPIDESFITGGNGWDDLL